MLSYIVVDTSYWVELFKVPGHYKQEYFLVIKERFAIARQNKYRLYLPIPVLFELANHIAHVDSGDERRRLSTLFSKTVKRGIVGEDTTLNIIPCMAFPVASELDKNLNYFVERFESEFSLQSLGFTDSSIILEAESLKTEINRVHIWTLDQPLKSREPDTESDAFIGV